MTTSLVDAPAAVRVAAPAKINLALHVTGRRSDGYHLLDTLVVFTRFGDELTLGKAETDIFAINGPFGQQLQQEDDNIVLKARDLFRRETGFDRPVSITLDKQMPIASGIGGGSSDAAATLTALDEVSGLELGTERLAQIGAMLGADVPICVHGIALAARGIGDDIAPIGAFPVLDMVLVNPGNAIATPDVFGLLQSRQNPPLPPFSDFTGAGPVCGWLSQTRNDLMAPAVELCSEIGKVIESLNDAGALFARMSGSGATCFGIFSSHQAAETAAEKIAASRPGWFVAATTTIGSDDIHEPH